MRRFGLIASAAFACAMALVPGSAQAAPASKKSKSTEPATPPAPPPDLQLEVAPIGELHGPWRLRVVNNGNAPVRLAADAKLVALDVEPPPKSEAEADKSTNAKTSKRAAKKAKGPTVVHCRLPADMRPSDEDARALIVPPGRSYVEAFDVRAICFGTELDALVPDAKVTPHLGWAPPATKARAKKDVKPSGPFVASPLDNDGSLTPPPFPAVSPLKQIDGKTFELTRPTPPGPTAQAAPATSTAPNAPAAPTTPAMTPPPDAPPSNDPASEQARTVGGLLLSTPRFHDQETRVDIPSPITVKNVGHRARSLLFRASRVRYEVIDPAGNHSTCGAPPDETPLREMYTRLNPGQSASLGMMVSGVCDPETFARAGVYEVTAHVDDQGLAGANLGEAAFDGSLSSGPFLIRLHRDSHPFPRRRPRLE